MSGQKAEVIQAGERWKRVHICTAGHTPEINGTSLEWNLTMVQSLPEQGNTFMPYMQQILIGCSAAGGSAMTWGRS